MPDWNAKQYSQNSLLQYNAFMSLFLQYPLVGNEAVLDIGCGDGKISLEIAKKVPEGTVIGIDTSIDMLSFAKSHCIHKNVTFEYYDAENLLSYHKSFDLIVSSFCLQWVKNKKTVFEGIKKCLRPSGKFILIIPIKNSVTAQIRKQMLEKVFWKNFFSHYIDPTVHGDDLNYYQYAISANLHIHTYEESTVTYYFDTIEAIRDFFTAITLHLAQLPSEHLKTQFMDEFMKRYIKEVPTNKEKGYPVTFTHIILVGTVD